MSEVHDSGERRPAEGGDNRSNTVNDHAFSYGIWVTCAVEGGKGERGWWEELNCVSRTHPRRLGQLFRYRSDESLRVGNAASSSCRMSLSLIVLDVFYW